MLPIKSVKELDVANKTVLVRTEFDVPVKNGRIEDDFRIRAALPTLNFLVQNKAKIIIISHLARPQGWEEKLSLLPVASHLAELLKRKLIVLEGQTRLPEYAVPHLYFFKANLQNTDLAELFSSQQQQDVIMLENLRFYPEEEACDEQFAKKLASLADMFVNEAFSNSHRPHASMMLLPKFLPRAAGLHLLSEIESLSRVISHPQKPLVVMIGGVKLEDKIGVIARLAKQAEAILLGGGVANLFLLLIGLEIGKTVRPTSFLKLARELWRDHRSKIKLPVDVVVASSEEAEAECVSVMKIKPHQMILDIGPRTIKNYSDYLKAGKTLLWNGPLGYFEEKRFSHGTYALARLFASRTKTYAYGVAGGGETLAALKKLGMQDYIDHLSTGGGAMLEFLAGKTLPGLEALKAL